MHWLIRRSVEGYIRVTYGDDFWHKLLKNRHSSGCALPVSTDGLKLVFVAAQRLDRDANDLLQALGMWIGRIPHITRTLRLTGQNFYEFVYNFETLPDWAQMVVPDLIIPPMQLIDDGGSVQLCLPDDQTAWAHILAGVLRAMGQEYRVECRVEVVGTTLLVDVPDHDLRDLSRPEMGGHIQNLPISGI